MIELSLQMLCHNSDMSLNFGECCATVDIVMSTGHQWHGMIE